MFAGFDPTKKKKEKREPDDSRTRQREKPNIDDKLLFRRL